MTCDEARLLAAEAALDLLDGEDRAALLDHVAGCAPCRVELASLAAAADALLLAAPPAEPPPGFEGRVLQRLADRRPARRWVLPMVAAVLAGLVGIGVGAALARRDGSDPVAARLLGGGGDPVGQVLVSDETDRMVCVLDGAPPGVRYDVRIDGGDGWEVVGSFTSGGPGAAWSVDLPVEGAQLRRVQILDESGEIRAWAEL